MKRVLILLFCLLLSLPLPGCGNGETAQSSERVTALPSPSLEEVQAMLPDVKLQSAEDVTPPDMLEQTGMRLLHCARQEPQDDVVTIRSEIDLPDFYLLLGPDGCAPLRTFYYSMEDPLWADLDGDGLAELVYQTPGPTSGVHTEAFWAYGLEDVFPVLKACSILMLSWTEEGNVRLEQDGSGIALVNAEARYPLALDGGNIVFQGGLPAGASDWGGSAWGVVGSSLASVRKWAADLIVYDTGCCVIWRTPGDSANGSPEIFAAMSSNWQTVTDLISFRMEENGTLGGWRPRIPLIETPTDLDSLLGLSVSELEEQLGPWHFDSGSGVYLPGWFTEDGLLLQVSAGATVDFVTLYDPMTDEVIEQAGLGGIGVADVVPDAP